MKTEPKNNIGYDYIPPKGGWEPHSYYVVELSVGKYNPIFSGILYTGFLDDSGELKRHSVVFMDSKIELLPYFKYLKAIRKIDMSVPNKGKLISEVYY